MSGYRSYPNRRRDASPTNLKKLLAGDRPLAALHQHAAEVAQLKIALWPYLPPSLRPHCDLANFRDGTLYVHADSPLWAAKARHVSPQILHTARVRCKISVSKVVVRVRWQGAPTNITHQAKFLKPAVNQHLEQAAEHCQDDDLAAIMRRIARRGKGADK